jgi:(p)ppGpp synthase/HD superfamily hydrolase
MSTVRKVNLEEKAKGFATERHEGQSRKYTGEPYINHPAAVVEIVRSVPHTEAMLAAAWLHDTVEDTDTTLQEIIGLFGTQVGMFVEMLTDTSKPEDGNRVLRKAIDCEHTAMAMPPAKTIKLADLIDNSYSILARDPEFAKVYLKEKGLLLQVLTEGDSFLWKRAKLIADNHPG